MIRSFASARGLGSLRKSFALASYQTISEDQVQKRIGDVLTLLKSEKVYNFESVESELQKNVKEMKFPAAYLTQFSAADHADHVLASLSAKLISKRTGSVDNMSFQLETENQALYCCACTPTLLAQLDRMIENYTRASKDGIGCSVSFFRSAGNISADIPHNMAVAIAIRSPCPKPAKQGESKLENLANQHVVKDYSPALKKRFQELLDKQNKSLTAATLVWDTPSLSAAGKKQKGVMIAYSQTRRNEGFWRDLSAILDNCHFSVEKRFAEEFSNGTLVYTFYISEASDAAIQKFLFDAALLDNLPNSVLNPLMHKGKLEAKHVAYAHSAEMFAFYFGIPQLNPDYVALKKELAPFPEKVSLLRAMNQRLSRGPSETFIYDTLIANPDLLVKLYDDFERKCKDGKDIGKLDASVKEAIDTVVLDRVANAILTGMLKFNAAVRKTNFFQPLKAAISHRLDSSFIKEHDFPDVPFGTFMIRGRDFKGFHNRFQDIARGGLRLLKSVDANVYDINNYAIFNEVYGLSYTQQKKNKDIPEGGSKGIVLLNQNYVGNGLLPFQQYIDSFLDLLLPNPHVLDGLRQPEVIFFGPDENTAEWMDWSALHSKSRGYKAWKSLTTGKSPSIGGIPHDIYGMTTITTHRCVLEALQKLGLEEKKVRKFQTAGPRGDLGCNEIVLSEDITIGVLDSTAVVFDPEGLNREELLRLCKIRSSIKGFDEKKLGPKGFKVLPTDRNKKLPNGDVVENGTVFRDEFHLQPYVTCELFVPCGGRPEAVNMGNVHRMLKPDGTPKFQIVVEGANLFITEEARLFLEKAGCIILKDASANKGGVTSSSHEVLCGLAMTDEDHQRLMCEKDGKLPEFYKEYTKEIIARLNRNAKNEFDLLWNENIRTGIPRPTITNILSDKINQMDAMIRKSDLFQNPTLRDKVLTAALPKTLLKQQGLEQILKLVPTNYVQAIFSNYLASNYVYQTGLQANEVGFFIFMKQFQ